jgi:hypothetical protein
MKNLGQQRRDANQDPQGRIQGRQDFFGFLKMDFVINPLLDVLLELCVQKVHTWHRQHVDSGTSSD